MTSYNVRDARSVGETVRSLVETYSDPEATRSQRLSAEKAVDLSVQRLVKRYLREVEIVG